MFDGYILTPDSVVNVVEAGAISGFEMRTRIPYYRGVPLSMVHDIKVAVNGEEVDPADIRFSADGGANWFTLEEMWTVSSYRWEYEDEALVRVMRPGGLAPGEYDITLDVAIRVAYIPVPFNGMMTRRVVIAA